MNLNAATQATIDEIRKLLAALPDEPTRIAVLEEVLVNRCHKCLDDESGSFWCCYDSRGD